MAHKSQQPRPVPQNRGWATRFALLASGLSRVATFSLLLALAPAAQAQTPPGPQVLSGNTGGAAPNVATGVEGNFFLDISSGKMWGPKTAGSWGSSIVQFPTSSITTASGTWTPALAGSTVAGTPTYTTQAGFYNRIGNMVWVNAFVQITAFGGSPTGNATITGLPLTASATTNNEANCSVGAYGGWTLTASYTQLEGKINENTSTIIFLQGGSGQANAAVPVANVGASSLISISCAYMLAP